MPKIIKPTVFTIDCTKPVTDGILDSQLFEKYLIERIKVEGRTNNLSSKVTVINNKNIITVTVENGTKFAKRYIKYLAKKFLKKHQLRDWLRVISTTKQGYEFRYFNIAGDESDNE